MRDEPDRILVDEVTIPELLLADPMGRDDWLLSARIYRSCRDAGPTTRSPMDCLIASHAIRSNVPVLAIDRDFETIASCTSLRLQRSPAQQLEDRCDACHLNKETSKMVVAWKPSRPDPVLSGPSSGQGPVEALTSSQPVNSLTGSRSCNTFTHMDEYKTSPLDRLFVAVADPTRRAILARLARSDARVTELAVDFPISLNSTSKHIKMLERAGLVRREVMGRDHVLSLNAAPLAEAAAWINHYRSFWDDRLAALEIFVTEKRSIPKGRKQT